MAENTEKKVTEAPAAEEPQDKVIEIKSTTDSTIKLSKPYKYNGREITELDLSGLADLTMSDYNQVRQYLTTKGIQLSNNMAELDPTVANAYAAMACHMPFDFFEGLNLKDSYAIKNRVVVFIYGEG